MTVEAAVPRNSASGNGVTTAFPFPYYFLANTDLVVIQKVTATGVETVKTLTTHYTVTGAGVAGGGTVTMLVAPPTGTKLIIYLDPEIEQQVDLVENDNSPAETQEQAFDRLTMIAQRLSNWISRTMKLSEGMPDGVFDPTLPVDIDLYPNTVPLINDDGDGFEDAANWPTGDDIAAAEANAAAAAASAAAALVSQTAAASSASAAATSATAAASSATAAAASATTATTQASNAATSATAAASSATAAAASAATATTQASNAATSATAAAASATTATTQATNAATSATNAASSATSAASSATAAAASAAAAAASGGGGGALQWIEDAEAPPSVVENSLLVYTFEPTVQQKLYTLIKVPNGYPGGTQIKLRTTWYSPDSSGNWGLRTLATLIRPGTDAASTTTNTNGSTQSGAMSAGTAGKPQAVTFDITNASGQINGVSVAAGNLIKIQLLEQGGTGSSDIRVPVYGAEVTFS